MEIKSLIHALTVGMLFLCACSENEGQEPKPDITPGEEDEEELVIPSPPANTSFLQDDKDVVKSLEAFSYDCFKAANATVRNIDGNFVVSPVNVQMLLSMVANVADEEAAAEIADVLGCGEVEKLNTLAYKYRYHLPSYSAESCKLAFSNKAWYSSQLSIRPNYDVLLDMMYDAPAQMRDFSSGQYLVDEINRWGKLHSGNVDVMMSEIDDDAVAVYAGALSYKARTYDFISGEFTENGIFHGLNGDVEVDMISVAISEGYIKTASYEAFRLPLMGYFSAWFLLPAANVDVDRIIEDFNPADFDKEEYAEITARIPRFTIDPGNLNVKEAVRHLGVNAIFDAEHLSMFKGAAHGVIELVTDAALSFGEDGFDARNLPYIESTGFPYPRPDIQIDITLDRPFIFFLQDWQTGICLMAGKVVNI